MHYENIQSGRENDFAMLNENNWIYGQDKIMSTPYDYISIMQWDGRKKSTNGLSSTKEEAAMTYNLGPRKNSALK